MSSIVPKKGFLFCLTLGLILLCSNNIQAQMRQLYVDNIADNEIYKLSFYSPSEGYVAFRDWIGYTTDSGRTFTKKFITNSNVNFNGYSVNLTFGFGIKGVKAFNQNNILAYGDYGLIPAILYSTNGGTSYTLIYHSQFNSLYLTTGITDMIFPQNSSIGYAIDGDRILKTTNQGLSWATVYSSPNTCFDHLDAIDDNNVFALSDYNIADILFPNGRTFINNRILRTTNAGTNWQNVSLPVGQVKNVSFFTATKAWLSLNQDLYYTSNTGTNWTKKNNSTVTPFYAGKIKFINDSTGFALRGLFEIAKTTDSGKVWEPLPRDNNYTHLGYSHNDLQFLSATQVWAGGGHGFLEMSTNGGGTPLPKAYFQVDTLGVSATGIVNLINFSKPGYQYKWIVNNILVSTNYHTSYTHALSSQVDSIKLIVISGSLSDTLVQYQYFVVPNLPVITSFTPATGSTGTFVTITGSAFTAVTSVKFGGVAAASFTVLNDNVITATVANGATGTVSVTDNNGTFSLPGFTYYAPYPTSPPLITSLSPTSGPVGTTVTITGNNFGVAPANNTVYFGAAKATVTSASATQIICTVPAGANFERLSVLNKTTNQSGKSFKPFNVTFADSSNFTGHSFVDSLDIFLPGPYIKDVAGKDIDGDGKPDLLCSYSLSKDSLAVFRNTYSGNNFSFAPRIIIGTIGQNSSGTFKADDIDGDGKPDIVCASNSVGPTTVIIRNTSTPGSISFENQVDIQSPSGASDVIISDLDNDGKNDIAIAGYNNSYVSVLRNTSVPGYFSFAEIQHNISGGNAVDLASGDIDGDGKNDLVSLNYLNGPPVASNLSYFRNTSTTGNISFTAKTDITVPGISQNGRVIELADYDNDNKLDIIVMNNNNCTIYRNTSTVGNISFAPEITFTFPGIAQGGHVSNLNGDMKPDLLTGGFNFYYFALYRNLSVPGSIINEHDANISSSSTLYYSNSADFNLDGKLDLIISNSGANTVRIFKNAMGIPIPFELCNGGSSLIVADLAGTSYQWQVDTGSGFTNLTNNGNISGVQSNTLNFVNIPISWHNYKFRCVVDTKLTSTFLMKIKPVLLPDVSISTVTNPSCYGYTVRFVATPLQSNGINTTYRWLVNGVFTFNYDFEFFANGLRTNDKVSCVIVDADSCWNNHYDTSNVITMTVLGEPNTVSISTPVTSVCLGMPVTFTATSVYTGASTYEWRVNGSTVSGATSSVFTTSALANGNTVDCVQWFSSTTCSAQSNTITMSVGSGSVIPAIAITATATTICSGTSVIFTAAITNGGTSPAYQWQLNGTNVGTNSNTFTSATLNNNDQVKCILTSNAACATPNIVNSNIINMTVSASGVVPSVTISTANTTVCAGSNVTFTAIPAYGGSSPNYQWQVNSINAGTNSDIFITNSLTNGSVVKVIMTSNASCAILPTATSNALTINISSVIPSVNISASSNNICPGTNVTFTATPANGGTTPIYQWKKNGINTGTNSNTYSSTTLLTGDVISVSLTSNAACATPAVVSSNNIIMTVNALTPATISINGVTTVSMGASTVISAVAGNGGSAPVYLWQDSTNTHTWQNINGATASSINYSPSLTGNKLKCILTGNNPCIANNTVTSNILTFTVTPGFTSPTFYPNPVSTYLVVDGLRYRDSWEGVHIVTMSGAKVITVPDLTGLTRVVVNIKSLPPGIYICVLSSRFGYAEYYKFVKL